MIEFKNRKRVIKMEVEVEKKKNNKISIIAYLMITLLMVSAVVFLIVSYATM